QDQENLKSPLLQSIGTAERLDLTYEHRVIEFDFTSLNYVKAHKNNFAYMLEGFDRDWRYTSADRRFATYTNLPAK
ncbi:MAG: triple tyrosine motif-containing protein, partial [Flammeovirgaceae bacterium]